VTASSLGQRFAELTTLLVLALSSPVATRSARPPVAMMPEEPAADYWAWEPAPFAPASSQSRPR